MGLAIVKQSEVSQKGKNKYHILTHICGIWKNGTDEPIFKVEIEAEMQRTDIWIPRWAGKAFRMNWEIGIDIYQLLCTKWGFPGGTVGKECTKAGDIRDTGSIPGLG